MVRAVGRWVLPCLALFIIGPLLSGLIGDLRAVDGGPDVTLLVGTTPLLGLVLGVICVAVALLYGAIAGKMLGERTGTLSAGLMLAWVAWGTGDLTKVWRFSGSSSTLLTVAVEAALLGAVCLAGVMFIHKMALDTKPAATKSSTKKDLMQPPIFVGILAGAAAAIALAWIVGFSGARGQALMAAVAGAIGAGVVTPMVIAAMGADRPVWFAPFLALLVAGIVAPLIGFIAPGAEHLEKAFINATMPGALVVQPLDWAAGMLLGVPIGMAWTAASIGKVEESASRPAASTTS